MRKKRVSDIIDLTGKVFGKLTVINLCDYRQEKQCVWKCLCECGNIVDVRGSQLRFNKTKSCGCLKHVKSKLSKAYEEISGSYFYHIRYGAETRDLSFNITIKDIWDLFILQNRKCALTGLELTFVSNYRGDKLKQTASLDRINSNIGYELNNICWVHKIINNMKQDHTLEEFLFMCLSISENVKSENFLFKDKLLNLELKSEKFIEKDVSIKRLNIEIVKLIREEYSKGIITQNELSNKYGVGETAISNIVSGKSWKDI